MKQKKNGLLTFLFSFIPGAAEMYTGLMKNGTSLMGCFFLCIMIPVYLKLDPVFLCPAVLAWFYSFFHARNLARRSAEEIVSLPDVYIWEEVSEETPKHKDLPLPKWTPYILIVCGVLILWNCVVYITDLLAESRVLHLILVNLPQAVIALLVIIAGLRMKRSQKKLAGLQAPASPEDLPAVAADPAEAQAAASAPTVPAAEPEETPEASPAPDAGDEPPEEPAEEEPAEKDPVAESAAEEPAEAQSDSVTAEAVEDRADTAEETAECSNDAEAE